MLFQSKVSPYCEHSGYTKDKDFEWRNLNKCLWLFRGCAEMKKNQKSTFQVILQIYCYSLASHQMVLCWSNYSWMVQNKVSLKWIKKLKVENIIRWMGVIIVLSKELSNKMSTKFRKRCLLLHAGWWFLDSVQDDKEKAHLWQHWGQRCLKGQAYHFPPEEQSLGTYARQMPSAKSLAFNYKVKYHSKIA